MNLRFGTVAVLGASICILVFGLGAAQATTITYNETSYAGGDFPASGYPSLGTLDIGLNSITGIATILGQPNVDTDTFSVILPAGDEITSGSWIITGGDGQPTPFNFGSSVGTVDEPLSGLSNISASGTLYLSAPYTTAGVLDIEVAGLNSCGGTPLVCEATGFGYTLNYTVAAIQPPPPSTPEPTPLFLLATGTLAFAGMARRKLFKA